jgi:hypothetical protein
MHTCFMRLQRQFICFAEIKAGVDVGLREFKAHIHEAHKMKAAELFVRNVLEGVGCIGVCVVDAVRAKKADLGGNAENIVVGFAVKAFQRIKAIGVGCRFIFFDQLRFGVAD